MLSEKIRTLYNIQCKDMRNLGDKILFRDGNNNYLLLPIRQIHHQNINELSLMANHLRNYGIKHVGHIIPTSSNAFSFDLDGEERVLIGIPSEGYLSRESVAKELAHFHRAGKSYSFKDLNSTSYNRWPEYWSERLAQLEKWRDSCLERAEQTEFDEWFVETFPYYLACTENAIQYYVDLRIDKGIREAPTISHHRFTSEMWYDPIMMKKPTDWVIDHPSRDLAEWFRFLILNRENPIHEISSILSDYEQIISLNTETRELIYARLLFPVHYIEVVENYYQSDNRYYERVYQERFLTILQQAKEFEDFLRQFPRLFRNKLRRLDWL